MPPLLAVLLLLSWPQPVSARDYGQPVAYGGLQLGIFTGDSSTPFGVAHPFDDATSVTVAGETHPAGELEAQLALNLGWRLDAHWAAEGDVTAVQRSFLVHFPGNATDQGPAHLTVLGLDVGGRYVRPVRAWEPYVGAGLGYYDANLLVNGATLGVPGEATLAAGEGLGGYGMLGLDYVLSPGLSVGAQERWIVLSLPLRHLEGSANLGGRLETLTVTMYQ
ncbi:MAG TPA: outer membrane beta-barrel protein [bacterium]|nr:outer membrane beta-barrel protein [bacterium]